ncbi:hypothetical protein BK140_35400, partial [Paenibacillus macerans]
MSTIKNIDGPKDFVFRVLSGVAIGIVAGLVPNAILGEIFKYFMQYHPIFKTLLGVVQAIQFTVPALIGALIAMKFNMTPLAIAVVASASYVGSGAAQFKQGTWVIAGIGGNMVNSFTELQPVFMSMLISMVFSFIIISPLSTVAIAIAIGLSGIAAGSASIGIAATEAVLLIGTSKVNHVGIPLSIFFGGVKMMMPNMVKYPVIMIPIFLTAAISGI